MLYAAIPQSLYKAKKNKLISIGAFNLYVKLCQFSDSKKRECWPSLKYTFKMNGKKIKCLRGELVSVGFLKIDKKGKRNLYKLLDPTLPTGSTLDPINGVSFDPRTNTTKTNSNKEKTSIINTITDCSNEQYMEEKFFSLSEKETEEKVSTIISEAQSPMVTDNEERSEERNLPPTETLSHLTKEERIVILREKADAKNLLRMKKLETA